MAVKVTLDIYSGRPNPEWGLSPELIIHLRKYLASIVARSTKESFPASPDLGYRGFHLLADEEDEFPEWFRIYRGVVQTEFGLYVDHNRSLERWLLESAPNMKEIKQLLQSELCGP